MNDFNSVVFSRLRLEQPIAGDILSSADGKPIRIAVRSKIDSNGESKRIVFCKVKIDVGQGRWVLHDGEVGIVCMILPGSQSRLEKDETGNFKVTSLRVHRYSASGKAILCEVEEV